MKLRTQVAGIVLSIVVVALLLDARPMEDPRPPSSLEPDAPTEGDSGEGDLGRAGTATKEAGELEVAAHAVTSASSADPTVPDGAPHPGIVPYLTGEQDSEAIEAVRTRVLRRIESDAELCRALDWLSTAEDPRLRSTAGRSLIGAIALGAELGYDVLPAIRRIVDDPDGATRLSAAYWLARGDTSAHRRLLLEMAHDTDLRVRTLVREEISARLDGEQFDTVAELLSASESAQEAWIGRALTPIATSTAHRPDRVDVPFGTPTRIPMTGLRPPPPTWIMADSERPPLPGGAVAYPDDVVHYMIGVYEPGTLVPSQPWGGTGGGVTWPFLAGGSWAIQNDVAFVKWSRELPGRRVRFWVRVVEMSDAREMGRRERER